MWWRLHCLLHTGIGYAAAAIVLALFPCPLRAALGLEALGDVYTQKALESGAPQRPQISLCALRVVGALPTSSQLKIKLSSPATLPPSAVQAVRRR